MVVFRLREDKMNGSVLGFGGNLWVEGGRRGAKRDAFNSPTNKLGPLS